MSMSLNSLSPLQSPPLSKPIITQSPAPRPVLPFWQTTGIGKKNDFGWGGGLGSISAKRAFPAKISFCLPPHPLPHPSLFFPISPFPNQFVPGPILPDHGPPDPGTQDPGHGKMKMKSGEEAERGGKRSIPSLLPSLPLAPGAV